MKQFVSNALGVIEYLEITDQPTKSIVMRFSKMYSWDKMTKIVHVVQLFPWWQKNKKAAFMKAVGLVNKKEKEVRHE